MMGRKYFWESCVEDTSLSDYLLLKKVKEKKIAEAQTHSKIITVKSLNRRISTYNVSCTEENTRVSDGLKMLLRSSTSLCLKQTRQNYEMLFLLKRMHGLYSWKENALVLCRCKKYNHVYILCTCHWSFCSQKKKKNCTEREACWNFAM